MCRFLLVFLLLLESWVGAAELKFDFGETGEGRTPQGFRSAVMGAGQPGDWKILLDPLPPALPVLTGKAPTDLKEPVLAQLARDPTDEHFPMLIYEGMTFGDFTLTTRFKTVGGTNEQMAGIAFRLQNETNYYVVRASSLGNTFRFYKVLAGQRGPLVGPDLRIPAGAWHELAVECKGSDIRCRLDGKEWISVTDKVNALTTGKIAFWTKSDSVSYFADTRITYKPFEPPAQALVRGLMKTHSRLLGLKIYVQDKDPQATRVVASKDPSDIGHAGGKTEQAVIGRGEVFYGKEKDTVSVIMPLRDRNGDTIAAVRVVMKSFPGQTEENAIVRATPIVKQIQGKVQSLEDLAE